MLLEDLGPVFIFQVTFVFLDIERKIFDGISVLLRIFYTVLNHKTSSLQYAGLGRRG